MATIYGRGNEEVQITNGRFFEINWNVIAGYNIPTRNVFMIHFFVMVFSIRYHTNNSEKYLYFSK